MLALVLALVAAPTPVPGQPYVARHAVDRFGRDVASFLGEASADTALPIAVYVQGSGCESLFARQGERLVPRGGHATLGDALRGRARVLVVEKPGVAFLDSPGGGGASACSATFRQEHVLERWAAAIEAALDEARTQPGCLATGALVVGHSEGALVACRVARDRPDVVSHVAVLAGGGASQLASLVTMARQGAFLRGVSDDPEARVRRLLADWDAVLADPSSAEKLFLGHPHRRWSSFLASSPLEELAGTKARIYVAQGLADDAVDPASADMLHAHLRSRGVSATIDRVEGADHSFSFRSEPSRDGWRELMDRIGAWWLGSRR